jgi:hypothetical protein
LPSVSREVEIRDEKYKEKIKKVENLFFLPYAPDPKIQLQPVRVIKPQKSLNPSYGRRTPYKIMTPVSVQARGFKARRSKKAMEKYHYLIDFLATHYTF